MGNARLRRSAHEQARCGLPRKTTVGAAVFLALYPLASLADQADASSATLQEITVTATRREQVLESVPYSLSVISAEQLSQSGVTDIMSLANNVPGLSMYDTGARLSASVAPIIRGINATAEPQRGFRTFEQNPVGTYIGNSPVDGYFQLDDLQQIEVLRGPQGTIYGPGALGGALRLIPNAPDPSAFAASVEAGGDRFYNSSGTGYTLKSMVNIPLADTVAIRASAKYEYDPGWIDVYGLLKRSNNSPNGIPVLADPGDPIDSPAIYSSREDWNFQKTFTGRIAGLWKPNETFSATLAFLHSNLQGDGGPSVNLSFPGGPSPSIRGSTCRPAENTRNSRKSISHFRATRISPVSIWLRRRIRHAVVDEPYLHDHRLGPAGSNLQSRRLFQRGRVPLLRRDAHQSSVRLRLFLCRSTTHLHRGSAPRIGRQEAERAGLRPWRLLREADQHGRLDHLRSGIARTRGAAGPDNSRGSRRCSFPADRHPALHR